MKSKATSSIFVSVAWAYEIMCVLNSVCATTLDARRGRQKLNNAIYSKELLLNALPWSMIY